MKEPHTYSLPNQFTPLRNIMVKICQEYDITEEEFLGRQKGARIVAIRLEAIHAGIDAGCSQAAIARAFNRHPTTILYALRKGK